MVSLDRVGLTDEAGEKEAREDTNRAPGDAVAAIGRAEVARAVAGTEDR